uniref:Uncharacterized protein n=1 Tax=Romanomermis culicivorax TaxID=13658 RepID=A0A915JW13_ROMCU
MTSAINSFCNDNFVERLTSKNDDEKAKAAQDLFDYLSGELAEKSADDVQLFLDHCDKTISDLLNSSDPNERKGGIYMMGKLINVF